MFVWTLKEEEAMKKESAKKYTPPIVREGRPLRYQEWFELKAGEFVFTYPLSSYSTIRASVYNYNRKYGTNLLCWKHGDRVVVGAK